MNISILLYEGITALDVVGPYEVFCNLPKVDIRFVAKEKGPISTDHKFLQLIATHKLSESDQADILLIPGSMITFLHIMSDQTVLNWIREVHRNTVYTASVCTGSLILAGAGLLKDKDATSHWYSRHLLSKFGAHPQDQRVVRDGKIFTAAGVSAGIDLALNLVMETSGYRYAQTIQLMLEYHPEPPFDSGTLENSDNRTIAMAKAKIEQGTQSELPLIDRAILKMLRSNYN